jgi:hypothetical protein
MNYASSKPYLFIAIVQWLEQNNKQVIFTWKENGVIRNRILYPYDSGHWVVNNSGWYCLGAEPSLIPIENWISLRAECNGEANGAGIDFNYQEHDVPNQGKQPLKSPTWYLHAYDNKPKLFLVKNNK